MAQWEDFNGLDAGVVEVKVTTMLNGKNSRYHFAIDRYAIFGDVKQRLSLKLARKFHEMKLIHRNKEPDMFEKLSNLRNQRGVVELTLVLTRNCRWCNQSIPDEPETLRTAPRAAGLPVLDTSIGDFCGVPCYSIMQHELQEQANVFYVFGVPPPKHYQSDPWLDRRY